MRESRIMRRSLGSVALHSPYRLTPWGFIIEPYTVRLIHSSIQRATTDSSLPARPPRCKREQSVRTARHSSPSQRLRSSSQDFSQQTYDHESIPSFENAFSRSSGKAEGRLGILMSCGRGWAQEGRPAGLIWGQISSVLDSVL